MSAADMLTLVTGHAKDIGLACHWGSVQVGPAPAIVCRRHTLSWVTAGEEVGSSLYRAS